MAVILEELKPLGNERFTAVLSGGDEIRVSTAIVADFSLYSGRELSDGELSELEAASGFLSCRERALKIIGARPMSCHELYTRLVEKGEDSSAAQACVDWLLERRYLDDSQYASQLVRHYSGKGYGLQRVKSELYRRGIAKTMWDEALSEMPDMGDAVYRLLCNKLRCDDPDRAQMKKATDALYRRGYSWDEIRAAVNRFNEERD